MPGLTSNNTNHLNDYLTLRTVTFDYWLAKTSMDFGVEDLHKLRVEIKKFRAFLRFLEIDGEVAFSKSEHFRLLAVLFKPGGRLRETQMNQALLRRYRSHSLAGYAAFLARRNAKQSVKLQRSIDQFDVRTFQEVNDFLREKLSRIDEAKLEKHAWAFIRKELATIRKLRPDIGNPKDLHQIRTHMKAMGYILRLIHELHPSEKLDHLMQSAKSAEKLIGNWHDRLVFRNSLLRYLQKHPDAPDRDSAERLLKQVAYRNSVAVRHISLRLDLFIYERW